MLKKLLKRYTKKEQIKNKFTINRSSVCMADDINDHRKEMRPLAHNTYLNIFKDVVNTNYLPRMTNEECLWVMVISENGLRKEVIEYYMGQDKYNIFENEILDNMEIFVEFVYYSRGRQ